MPKTVSGDTVELQPDLCEEQQKSLLPALNLPAMFNVPTQAFFSSLSNLLQGSISPSPWVDVLHCPNDP
jgi:hypothetical protein